MLDFVKKIASENLVSEEIITMILKSVFEKELAQQYSEADAICFTIETSTAYLIKSGHVEEKELKQFGRRFVLTISKSFSILLNKAYPEKFPEFKELQAKDDYYRKKSNYYENGPYCSACQQAPCMCSDREATSTIHDF